MNKGIKVKMKEASISYEVWIWNQNKARYCVVWKAKRRHLKIQIY